MNASFNATIHTFDRHWKRINQDSGFHYSPGQPNTQVQFAYQNHFRVFSRLMQSITVECILEVGCGRGSMGAYFAKQGKRVHLLDSSWDALGMARGNFAKHGLSGQPVQADARSLPYCDNNFDIVVSIGLLEHFDDVTGLLSEQVRVLKPGGMLLAYVVPERRFSIQTLAIPLNLLLHLGHRLLAPERKPTKATPKEPLYRNHYKPGHYLSILKYLGIVSPKAVGMYPLPLVSHSPSFPFSSMAPFLEKTLIRLWRVVLSARRLVTVDPWLCPPRWGLAFLVWGHKGEQS